MKKIEKKIGIVFLVIIMFISFFYKPSVIKAEESKTYVIELPSNEISTMNYYSKITYLDYLRFEVWREFFHYHVGGTTNSSYYMNSNEEMVIHNIGDKDEEIMQYEYVDGITEEDCIFDITDEMAEESIEEYGFDLFEGYNRIQVVLKEFDDLEIQDTYEIDLTYMSDVLGMNTLDYYLLGWIVDSSFEYMNCYEVIRYTNINGKELFREIYRNEDDYEFFVADNLTSEDDVIYELADGESIINNMGMTLNSNQNKIVLKFSDKEYDESYYVVDYSTAESISNDENGKWEFFMKKDLLDESYITTCADKAGNKMFDVEGIKLTNIKDFEYTDNIVVDVKTDEKLTEIFSEMGLDEVNTLIIKFADPKFIEGENQEYNLSKDDKLSFRLDIPYDQFLESGVVYVDDEIVNPEKYDVSEGSTIITFKPSFASSLNTGNHVIRASVTGGAATASFNIVGESPATGDNIYLYLSLLILSIGGLLIIRKLQTNKN